MALPSFVIFVTGYGGPVFHVGKLRSPRHRDQALQRGGLDRPAAYGLAAGLPGVA